MFKKIVILNIVLAMIFTGCGQTKEVKKVEKIKNVKVVKSEINNIETDVEYSSKLKPLSEINVSAKSPGKVVKTYFDVGKYVEKGAVLFELDQKDIKTQINQQEANVRVAQANLDKTSDSTLSQQIATSEQAVERAQLNFDTAEYNLNKANEQFEKLQISKNELIDFENKYKSTKTELDAAKENLDILVERSAPQTVEAAKAQVAQSEAGLQSSMSSLDNTVIEAPMSGVISVKNVDAGEMSPTSMPAYTIIDITSLIAEVNISDKMAQKLEVGQKLKLKLNSSDLEKDVTLDSISPIVDDKTQNYIAKLICDNKDGVLKAGMMAKIKFPSESRKEVIVVPKTAVVTEDTINYVYSVKNGKIKKISVNVGLANVNMIEIKENLEAGIDIVTEGQIFLNEDEKVNIVNE